MPKVDNDYLYCACQRIYNSFALTGGIFISSADFRALGSLQLCKAFSLITSTHWIIEE